MTYGELLLQLSTWGWPVERLSDTTARCRFHGEQRSFPFFVHLDNGYVQLAAIPYLRLPVDDTKAEALMSRLLHLNREINFAKFSVDDDGDVVLSVEYPLMDMDESELRDAVDVLCAYADKYWAELNALAAETSPEPHLGTSR